MITVLLKLLHHVVQLILQILDVLRAEDIAETETQALLHVNVLAEFQRRQHGICDAQRRPAGRPSKADNAAVAGEHLRFRLFYQVEVLLKEVDDGDVVDEGQLEDVTGAFQRKAIAEAVRQTALKGVYFLEKGKMKHKLAFFKF